MPRRPELALALDVMSVHELDQWVDTFIGLPVVLKLGLRLLPLLDVRDFERIQEDGFKIFVDAKLHDIPSTVCGAVETWAAWKAEYLTVHLSGGPKMLRDAVKVANGRIELLGVSVLTSLSADDLKVMGFVPDPAKQVDALVRMALQNGMRSFVCSVNEARLVKDIARELGVAEPVRTVCPGIRAENSPGQEDQSRSYTAREAVAAGVDMLVVGRAILKDSDPRARAEEILEMIK